MSHLCHWPNCKTEVSPSLWGCKRHWFSLPKYLRDAIWLAYRQGQEIDKNPSARYLSVAQEARAWINEFEAGKTRTEHGEVIDRETGEINGAA